MQGQDTCTRNLPQGLFQGQPASPWGSLHPPALPLPSALSPFFDSVEVLPHHPWPKGAWHAREPLMGDEGRQHGHHFQAGDA